MTSVFTDRADTVAEWIMRLIEDTRDPRLIEDARDPRERKRQIAELINTEFDDVAEGVRADLETGNV